MRYNPLGHSGLSVSEICLGTMTWGNQNTEAEGHAQMDHAVERGVNFFDAAEMYPIPPKGERWGRTEEIIGSWFARTGRREDIVLATKVVGRAAFEGVRSGVQRLDRNNIEAAVEASLKRLRTDRIDLYQLHWPERKANRFGNRNFRWDPEDTDWIPLAETFKVLGNLVRDGKIRYVGLSNDTPWGFMTALKLAEQEGLPRVVSVQNSYSLLDRSYEIGMAEISLREGPGLLPYSPIGGGALTGKYLGEQWPDQARFTLFGSNRYLRPRAQEATAEYVALAREHGVDPAQMAVAFTLRQPFVTSSIVGGTSVDHIKNNLAAAELSLSDEILEAIEAIHERFPNPSP